MFNLQPSSPLLQALCLCLLLLLAATTTTTHAADPLNQIIREQQWDATHVLLVQITSNGTATDIFESECGFDTYYETGAIVLGVNRTVDPDATAIGAITRGTVHKQCDTIEFKTWARQWKEEDTCEPDRYNDPGRKMDGTCGYIYLTPGMVATDPYVLVARGCHCCPSSRPRSIQPRFPTQTMTASPNLPDLPITNLGNAEFTATKAAFSGGNTVIDFWTTKCTNCPEALDNLNDLAADERYRNVEFASICCDSCDDARNIIDKEDTPRWDKVSHYFMDFEHKEQAKKTLGFRQVPFYVVLDEEGEIVQMGSKKSIDFDNLPGMTKPDGNASKEETKAGEKDGAFEILDLDF